MPLSQPRFWQYLITVSAIATVYLATAKLAVVTLGLGAEASPVWPPAGIALAALLLYGRSTWIGVALGAFLFAQSFGVSDLVASIAALSSSLQAVAGELFLRRFGFDANLRRLRDVFGLVVLAAIISTLINATLSTASGCLATGMVDCRNANQNWWTIWLGDGMGILVITPVLLVWRHEPFLTFLKKQPLRDVLTRWTKHKSFRWHIAEGAVWATLLLCVCWLVFESESSTPLNQSFKTIAQYPLEYLPFPLIVWAALRLGQHGAVLSSLVVSTAAIWGATQGHGPFIAKSETIEQAVLLLQAFTGVTTVTALVLAAAVAERQQVEDLLRRSEASLSNAQRIAHVGNWDLDLTHEPLGRPLLDGKMASRELRWSDELYRILGLSPRSQEPSWAVFLETVHPDDQERVMQAIQAAVFERTPYALDYRIVLPNGCERIVNEQVEIRATGMTGTIQDVTERKQSELALQQSEARFRVVAETAACGIFVYQGTQFRYVNPATETITGYTCEELLQMPFWQMIHPDFQAIVKERGLARQRGEAVPNRYELKIVTKEGEERWIDFMADFIYFEGQPAALGTGFDITDRKQAEAQLRATADRDRLLGEIALRIRQSLNLDEILQNTVAEVRQFLQADRVFISHIDSGDRGIVVAESVDPNWRSIVGWETGTSQAEEVRSIFAQQRVRVINDTSQVPLTPFLREYYAYCQVKAGIAVPIMQGDRMFGVLVANQCSSPRQWQSFEIELLEQLSTQVAIAIQQAQLYQQVQNLSTNLQQQVEERTAQLQHNMQELQNSNQVKDILLHAVSHDLRTPVQGILMVLNNLYNKSGETVSITRPILERMIHSSARQLELINSLSEGHCSDSKRLALNCQPTRISDVIQTSLNQLNPALTHNEIKITNLVEAELPLIKADPSQLERVYENLLDNAVRHNPPGTAITLTAEVRTDQLYCTVCDNGVGMIPEQCDRLFQLYVRGLDNRHLTGIGLGLYACRQIIEAHGGATGVISEPGSGATFWFTLPLAQV